MLQTVIRSSIVSERMALPRYSSAWPVAPAVPILAISERIRSLAPTLFASAPVNSMANDFGRRCSRHWVASTWPTSVVPMPKASTPKAPWVLVWLSPHTIVDPGCVSPSSGPITCTIPCLPSPTGNNGTPKSLQLRSSAATCSAAAPCAGARRPSGPSRVGIAWSIVATVRCVRRTFNPRARSSPKACGEVTSWTRCKSTYRTAGVSAVSADTRCASQILSTTVRGRSCIGWSPQAAARASRAEATAER
jgi:hypothetical protein